MRSIWGDVIDPARILTCDVICRPSIRFVYRCVKIVADTFRKRTLMYQGMLIDASYAGETQSKVTRGYAATHNPFLYRRFGQWLHCERHGVTIRQ